MRTETPFRALRAALPHLIPALLLVLAAISAFAQNSPAPAAPAPTSPTLSISDPLLTQPPALPTNAPVDSAAALPASIQPLLDFRAADVKFSLPDLMDLLRDRRHEGWVLAAYPDPKTGRPLIGAGVSLDLPERQHPQTDPLNPHAFIEPSSAELWQAAGLDPARLRQILDGFDENAVLWHAMRRHHRRVPALEPEITDTEAESLLRVSVIQAIDNARAYCRNFDRLTSPQQMALSQLVYQMGVNLSEFGQFLSLINNNPTLAAAVTTETSPAASDTAASPSPVLLTQATPSTLDVRYWDDVRDTLIHSQWARLYRVRAVAVIAMLDPRYAQDPAASEQRVAEILHPARRHHRSTRPALRTAAWHRRSERTIARRASRPHTRRKA